jgi:hypothetical protein
MRMLALALLTLTGCPKDPSETGGDFPPVCNDGTRWAEGQPSFQDATAAWGLDIIDAEATRISAVDFDGDGWTDLALRRATDAPDDFSEGGTRNTWLLRNTGDGSFEDVTESSGVTTSRSGDGARGGQVWAFADADNDGDLDLLTGFTDLDSAYDETTDLMLNNGDGTFSLGSPGGDIRYNGDTSPAGVSWVDYDLDGDVDLWIPEYYVAQDRLYANDGNASFSDVTYDAALGTNGWTTAALNAGTAHSLAWSGLACDLNNDGYAELMAASYGRAPNSLHQALGDGTYENRSVDSSYAWDHRQDWSDNESARCWCKLHPEDDDCEGVPEPNITCTQDDHAFRWDHESDRNLYRLGGNSGATTCADVNNDGWMDLLTSEIVHWDVGSSSDPAELLFNQQQSDVTFDRPGNDVTGLTREHTVVSWNDGDMSNAVLDFDNDGWPDPFIGSSDYEGCRALLWQNQGDETFVPVPHDMGLDHTRSHGVGVADFDRDGDLDLVLGHSSSRCEDDCYDTFNVRLFENLAGQDGNFVQLSLEGVTANRAAIGARVTVSAGGVTQTQDIGGGYGHYGAQQDLTLHFGLGTACEAEVTVRWPDSDLSEQSFTVGGGYRYHVVQGSEPIPELL